MHWLLWQRGDSKQASNIRGVTPRPYWCQGRCLTMGLCGGVAGKSLAPLLGG